VSEEHAEGWAATVTLTFDGGEGRFDWVGESDPSFSCLTTYEVVDDFVRLTYESLPNAPSEECDGTVEDWRWRMEGDALVFDLLDSYDTPFVEDTVAYEVAPYVRVT
jgi:hypothetical protein